MKDRINEIIINLIGGVEEKRFASGMKLEQFLLRKLVEFGAFLQRNMMFAAVVIAVFVFFANFSNSFADKTLFSAIKYDYFPFFAVFILALMVFRNDAKNFKILKPFLIIWDCLSFVILLGFLGFLQIVSPFFYALFFAIAALILTLIVLISCQKNFINFRKYWYVIILAFLSTSSDDNSIKILCDLTMLWWIAALLLYRFQYNSFSGNLQKYRRKFWTIFLPLFAITISLSFFPFLHSVLWIFSAAIFSALLVWNQIFYQKVFAKNEFSILSLAVIFVVFGLIA